MDPWIRKSLTRPVLGDKMMMMKTSNYLLTQHDVLELPPNISAAAQNKKNEQSPLPNLFYSCYRVTLLCHGAINIT
jgi:hypothetical protein